MKLSIIIPVYNGAKTIGNLVQVLEMELLPKFDLEIVLVNDCSPSDNSSEICERIAHKNRWVKYLDLSRNFGEHNAVMAGLSYCTGEAAVIMDDDFQNDPLDVIKLVESLAEGYDVVYSYYEKKEHHFLRNVGSKFNNLVASILIRKPIGLYLSSFKAINRFAIDELVKYTGPYPYIDGLIWRITRNYGRVLVRHNPRYDGQSGYTLPKLVSLWLNMFTNFSILPLRIAAIMGFVVSLLGLITAIGVFIERMRNPDVPVGWTSLIVALLVTAGIQLFAIGMVGEYLGRMFMKASGEPQFVIRKTVNCERRNDTDK